MLYRPSIRKVATLVHRALHKAWTWYHDWYRSVYWDHLTPDADDVAWAERVYAELDATGQ